jgi:glucose-6-phosphate 1-dehydrogenase
LDPAAFDKLVGLLRYVRGDNSDPATYKALRRELGDACHPAYSLAIPPTAFATVVEQLISAGCAEDARGILEKPFGTIPGRGSLCNVSPRQIKLPR